jgi:signal transduction histidine kinase
MNVTLTLGEIAPVSPGAQVTVCAAVREGLNNALRHAGPTDVSVNVRRDGDTIITEIHDAGPRTTHDLQPGAGQGLLGLRERLAAFGGTLHAAPHGTGWLLSVRILDPVAP